MPVKRRLRFSPTIPAITTAKLFPRCHASRVRRGQGEQWFPDPRQPCVSESHESANGPHASQLRVLARQL